MNKLVAVVGMCGSGKSEVTNMFTDNGFSKVYFGDVTFEELKRRNMETNWANEKLIREEFRSSGDMAIYAKLNEKKIASLLKKGNVVIESLYSWSEYKYLKDIYKENFFLISIITDLEIREKRLSTRTIRPMTIDDIRQRDYSEIENLEKGGPIVRADYNILNNQNFEELQSKVNEVIKKIINR